MHNYTSTRHSALLTPQPSAYKTTHTCHVCQSSLAIKLQPPTTQLTLHASQYTLPSTILLCTQQTQLRCSWQNSTRRRDGVKVFWCLSYLGWLVFEDSIPTCTCFCSENFFVTLSRCFPHAQMHVGIFAFKCLCPL